MKTYSLGLDFGTNSCRSLIVDLKNGREIASQVVPYPSGQAGIFLNPIDPNVARQNAEDYLFSMRESVRRAIDWAKHAVSSFESARIIGIGIDTTGSSPMPVNEEGLPLSQIPEFKGNLDAMVWLWKDHSSFAEAARITDLAEKIRPHYLATIGGIYSSEWFWSKILHCKNISPEVFQAAYSFVEICDYIPAVLAGNSKPDSLVRSICAAGHKALYNETWGGLPDKEFLSELHPDLGELRNRLYKNAVSSDQLAGHLCREWADELGLDPGIAIAVGAFDAHMGAVGAGVKEGTLVKILGTSTCDIMVSPREKGLENIPGVCGIVDGSVLPGFLGIEAGQSAVGDIFSWFVHHLVPNSYGQTVEEKFINLEKEASLQKPGEHGLIALDWNNGNRTILVDVRLSGLLIGQTLQTQAHEIYRALIEATAFGALTIINRIEDYSVAVHEVINCGGLAAKNPFLLQIYADITGRTMKVSQSDQTCALGAAIFGAVAAGPEQGGFKTVEEAQRAVSGTREVYFPDKINHAVYRDMFKLYRQLHDAFGTTSWSGSLSSVMKDLIALREAQRDRRNNA
ncbi:MAG: ribulokinase [Candidatus Aminicenantes bacterium]|nr:ribulokinase [Candidatus Aminicenantes bacterium]